MTRPGSDGPARRREEGGFLLLVAVAVLLLCSPAGAGGQETTSRPASLLLLDPSMGVRATTSTLHAGVQGLYAVEDRMLPVRFGDEDGPAGKGLGVAYRLARLSLVDYPVTGLHGIVRHEVAGHGGAIRQLDGDVLEYTIEAPYPYGAGGGTTVFAFDEVDPVELVAVIGGGLESSYLDARELEERWVARDRMDYREALQYLYDVGELLEYIEDARPGPPSPGHDIENYVAAVNVAAPEGASGSAVTASSLEDAAVVEVLNPTVYYSLFSVAWRFLAQGESDGPVPAPEIGPVRMLPSLHLRLTPFGREHVVGGTAAWGRRVLRAGVRLGSGPWGSFGGLELSGRRLYAGTRFELGGRVGLWRQYGLDGVSDEGELGGMALARGTFDIGGFPVDAVVEVGAKSDGYVPGEALDAGGIARLGVSAVF